MCRLPRIALGSVQRNVDIQPMLGALIEVLRRGGVDSQAFHSQSRFVSVDAAYVVSGKRQRHLDSWLMTPEVCRSAFCYGSQGCDLSLVVGRFADASDTEPRGGTLDDLCEWLELPQIVVLDVSRLGPCCLPQLPPQAVGVFLDGLESLDEFVRWQTFMESHLGVRVLGALMDSPAIRQQWQKRSEAGGCPKELVGILADQLSLTLRWDLLSKIANQLPSSWTDAQDITPTFGRYDLNVAIAYDDAFNCYFPDTLDVLEMQGARLCDFSPLKGDKLPADCDLVLFGCGHPERYADSLARNCCIKQALHHHIRSGRRVYAEGGGLAYACRTMVCRAGRFEMAGLLPAIAHHGEVRSEPVELRLSKATWLGAADATIRGYRNACWRLEACAGLQDYGDDPQFRLDIVGHRRVLGSRLHLHFSSQPDMLRNLLKPRRVLGC